ncbi:MAG: hypothetical protein QM523_01045 [Candidatus Pacebacteria bacterium]|nr:hypothetical protein [Candidatus Paceibacterota bacterium]
MQNNEALVVPFFKTMANEDPNASKEQGRPIFNDLEIVEIRIAGDRNYAPVFPAHSMWQRVDGNPVTYAERWPEAYARFKAGQEQVAAGTPLSELPFLSEAKRAELRALKVYTAEALASMDGKNLKALGDTGREMKNQATAYLAKAVSSAGTVALAAEVEALKAELAAMRGTTEPEHDDEKEALKVQIATLTGQRPRGNPSTETLREMLSDLQVTA